MDALEQALDSAFGPPPKSAKLKTKSVIKGSSDPLDDALESAFADEPAPGTQEPYKGPVRAGLIESLPEVPEKLLRLVASGLSPKLGTEEIASHVQDLVMAESGDLEAAKRARAYETALSAAASVVPGGPAVRLGTGAGKALLGRAAVGALGGGVTSGAEAVARGDEFLPAAGSGAAVGAVLNPVLGLGQGFLARKAAERLVNAGKPVPVELAQKVAEEANPAPVTDPVKRVIAALEEVPSKLKEQEAMVKAERGVRIRKFRAAGEGASGEAGARGQLAQMAGEMQKVEFGSLRGLVQQTDVDQIFDIVKSSPLLGEFEKVNATSTLLKLFGESGFNLPSRSQLQILEKALGSEFVETILKKQPEMSKLKKLGLELVSAPRVLMSSFDMSAPLRQGLYLGAGHPREFAGAFKAMVSGLGTKQGTKALELAIAQDPLYQHALDAGLAITKAGSVVGNQEEAFAGHIASKFAPIAFSERAYTGFLNKLRFDSFKSMLRDAERAGYDITNERLLKDLGTFINAASGRGNLPKSVGRHAESLNALFFSPRLMASRIQTLNPALYIKSDPIVRKHAWRSMLSLGSLATSVIGLAGLAGADVETDMTSPDWGKVKVGNTRYDILGGYQQYLRLGALVAKGAAEGEGVSGKVVGGFKPTLGFLRRKLAPVPSLVADLWQGTDFSGKDVNVPLSVMERFTPMILQDTYDAVKEWGWIGVPMTAPAFFGTGVTTYGD